MNRRHVLALLPALAGCGSSETVTRRIRIIAKAEVDGKEVEGSTVMELTWRAGGGRMYHEPYGEALVPELNGRGTVYILPTFINPDDGQFGIGYWFGAVNQTLGIEGNGQIGDLPVIEAANGKYPVSGIGKKRFMPLMVSFRDEIRKDSIFQVFPDSFENTFGQGVKLTSITVAFCCGF